MALTVGELVAYAQVDKSNFSAGVQGIGSDLNRLQSSTSSSMASMESTVTKSLAEIERSIADGLDPTAAIADLDRLERELDAGLDEMLAEADRFAAELDATIDEAFDRLDDDAQASGKRAGDELVDGLRAGVRDAERVARDAGEGAGDSFGDGVESEGQGRMSGVGDTLMSGLKSAGIGLALAAGAAIGASLVKGIEGALEKESLLAKLSAQIGASEAEMARLGKVAGEVYSQGYGEGLGDVTEALKSVIQNVDGVRDASDEALGTLSKRALDAATILDGDLGEVTAAVSQMLRTGVAKNAEEAFDILVRGAQLGLNKSGDLLTSFNEYSTQFRSLGLDGKASLGMISQLLQGGARDADVAVDALKEFALEAVQGSDKIRGGLKSLGLDADDMIGKLAKGGPTAAAAFDLMVDKLVAVEDPVKRNAIAVELFGTKAEDLGQALFSLDPSAAVESLGQVDGAAKKAGDTLHDTAENRLTSFKRSLETNVVDFLGGTVLPAVEQFAADFDRGFELTGAAEKIAEWRDELGEIWDSIVADVQEWVTANSETIEEWKTKLSEGFESAKTTVDDTLSFIKELWDEYGDDIIETVSFLVDTFLNIWNGFWGTVSGAIKVAKGILTGDFDEIKAGLTQIWNSLWQAVEDQITRTLDLVKKIASETWENLKKDATAAWDRLSKAVGDGVDDAVKFVKELPTKIDAVFANAKTWLLQAGKDLLIGFINGVKAMAQEVVDTVSGITQKMVDTAKRVIDSHSPSKVFDQIGRWTMQGLIQGLTAEGANVESTVKDLVGKIKEAFKSQPDVADGLIDFVKVGNKSLEALAKQRQELVEQLAAAKEYAKQVAGSAQEWADITGLKPEDIGGAGDMASELQGKARAINDFANNIQTLAKRGLNKKIIQDIIDAGVEKGASFAEMLVGSDGSEIKALNKAQAAVDKASKKLGKASADAMYDVGKKSGEGYLKGLTESLKELDKEMAKIAKALIAAIKKELKIKSPSQVMAEIGQWTMAGYIEGIQSMESSTLAAMTGLVGKAVSATSDAAVGSVGKAATSTLGKQQILGATYGTAGVAFDGPLFGGPRAGAQDAPPAGGVTVNVDMSGSTIRDPVDVTKVVKGFGYELAVAG
ncbi:phage tail tape measure protein [Streptosporangium sp. NPDC049078]|uniref:phage tail tape measure protein n=1 Tax=Streptosporangium sp. NPDC049078 TaxID=3155767 RepID=UPI003431C731